MLEFQASFVFILSFMHVCMQYKCITNHFIQQNLLLLPGISLVAVTLCTILKDICVLLYSKIDGS